MPKELDERDKKKEWKDDRKFRRGGRPDRGPRHGGGYEARSSAPTGDRAPEGAAGTTAPAAPAADSSAKPSSEGPSS